MKAAILNELNVPLIVDSIEVPELHFGQVLVEIHYSTICGAQIREIAGANGLDRYLPHLLGHEGGGIVKAVGPGVNQVAEDDHVVLHWRKGPGIDAPTQTKYQWGDRTVGAGKITTFSEFAVVSENRVTRINNDIPLKIASLMGCAVTTALGVINNDAQLKIGQSIAIAGCGGVGLNIIQAAKMVSAGEIIAIDVFPSKLELAIKFGATEVYNFINQAVMDKFRTIAARGGVDIFVDCTGAMNIVDAGFLMTAPGGKIILVGQPWHNKHLIITDMSQHYCGKHMFDSHGGQTEPAIDIPRYLKLYQSGTLKLDELITHTYPLNEINEAIKMTKSGNAIKVALEMR